MDSCSATSHTDIHIPAVLSAGRIAAGSGGNTAHGPTPKLPDQFVAVHASRLSVTRYLDFN